MELEWFKEDHTGKDLLSHYCVSIEGCMGYVWEVGQTIWESSSPPITSPDMLDHQPFWSDFEYPPLMGGGVEWSNANDAGRDMPSQ